MHPFQQCEEAPVLLGQAAITNDGPPAGVEIPLVNLELVQGLALEHDPEAVEAVDGLHHFGRVIGEWGISLDGGLGHGFLL